MPVRYVMTGQPIRTIAATPTEVGRGSYRGGGGGGSEGSEGNYDYCELLALARFPICLVLLTATVNVYARLGCVVCQIDAIGERETRAVADAARDDVMANSSGDESDREW